jgi:hypothetical protein
VKLIVKIAKPRNLEAGKLAAIRHLRSLARAFFYGLRGQILVDDLRGLLGGRLFASSWWNGESYRFPRINQLPNYCWLRSSLDREIQVSAFKASGCRGNENVGSAHTSFSVNTAAIDSFNLLIRH